MNDLRYALRRLLKNPGSISGQFEVRGDRAAAGCVSPARFLELRQNGAGFADVLGFAPLDDVNAQVRRAALAANGMIVSDNFFSALGVEPAFGHLWVPETTSPRRRSRW